MKPSLTLLLVFCFSFSHAQLQDYTISPPLNIRNTGCNKVLCMKNGNTLLFHFEPAKSILVKVFDSLHREIASRRDNCRLLDDFRMEYIVFKGLFEINGQAVLFLQQDDNGRNDLIRLQYDAATGALSDEEWAGKSESQNNRMQYYVMNNKDNDSYEILYCMDRRHPRESDIYLQYFNNSHEPVRTVPIELNRRKFDFLTVLGAESQPNGILVTLGLDKTVAYGGAADLNTTLFAKPDHDSSLRIGASIFEHYLSYYYIPNDSAAIFSGIVDLSKVIYPYFSLYTYNPFAARLNLFLYSFKPFNYLFGFSEMLGSKNDNLFFSIDKKNDVYLNVMRSSLNDVDSEQRDTSVPFRGMPLKLFTDENGLSTLISESCDRYGEMETGDRYVYQNYFNDITITQFDDFGNVIWSTVLPFAQYFKSYTAYLDEKLLSKHWQEQPVFGDLLPQVYDRQFLSCNVYHTGKSFYIICNDYSKYLNHRPGKHRDTVYTFDNTDACYYKIGPQKEVTQGCLFGKPSYGESRTSFIEGADFDERRGVYAALLQCRKNNKARLCMAWRQLD